MIKRKKGHVINVGCTAGHDVYPAGNVYAATKFAVEALSQSIRYDVLDKGIKVTSVDPGMVETEFSLVRFRGDKERAKKVYTGIKPLSPKDVAETIFVLCNKTSECKYQPGDFNTFVSGFFDSGYKKRKIVN